MLTSYPQVPTGYELGIGVAVQSYDQRMFFGIIADAAVVPDVTRFRDYIRATFRNLCRAAGVKKPGRKPPRRTVAEFPVRPAAGAD
jgi:hypothetical protein